jgi:hypothetical protein
MSKHVDYGQQDLKRLRAANGGDVKAWKRILDLATGRKGKLRHELLEVGLSDIHSSGG